MLQLQRLLRPFTQLNNQLLRYSTRAERRAAAAERAAEHGGLFPDTFFFKKMKTPDHLYIANAETAQVIDEAIAPFLQNSRCKTALEINPGAGFFTQHLLNHEQFQKIILIEATEYFLTNLYKIHTTHPHRLSIKHGDLVGLWKLAFQDKLDKGTRVEELLQDVPTQVTGNEATNVMLFGAHGSYNFFKHLINSVVFQNSLTRLGHYEMFLIVPPPIYIHLTCSNEIGYMIYRSSSILFQMLFEHRFIAQIPREHFLPKQIEFNPVKGSKLLRITSVNPEYLYLVKIAPRKNVLDLCAAEDLPALWYFIKQNCVSRRNRIIPNLEKWIPGCGPRLIIQKKERITVEPLYDDEDIQKLPKYSKQSTTMSCQDFYPNINIYTQFGDLSPSQLLTLFTQFRQWPEYAESSFLASLENTLLKLETSSDESVDGIGITEEDDVGANDTITSEKAENNTANNNKAQKPL